MKELLIMIITFLLLGFLPAGLKAQSLDERELDYFNEVLIKGHFELVLEQGDLPSIRLEAKSMDRIREVATEVSDRKLRIRYNKEHRKCKWDAYPKIRVHLVYPALEKLRVEGKVQLATYNAIQAEDLNLDLHGYVTGEMALRVGKLDIDAEGYTKLELSGLAGEQFITLEGLGKVKALDLSSQTADVELDGVAKAHVNVSEELRANLDGASKLKYKGGPEIRNIQKDGLSGVSELDQ